MYQMADQEVVEMAGQILEKDHSHLLDANISYLFRDRPWKKGDGRTVLGRASKRNEIDRVLSQKREDFIVIIAKPRWDSMTEEERRCLLDHELCHCFADNRAKVYTVSGWKRIRDVKVGELVLTHRGRFRKVTSLFTRVGVEPEMVTITSGREFLSVTSEHPIFTNGICKVVKDIKKGEEISFLASRCERCGNLTTFGKRFCSDSDVRDELDKCVGSVKQLVLNHQGKFEFTKIKVKEVRHWRYTTKRLLYNLGVEEDESYVVKGGFVVHNCGVRISNSGDRQWILRSHAIEEFPENLARFGFRREQMGLLIEHPPSAIVTRPGRRIRPV